MSVPLYGIHFYMCTTYTAYSQTGHVFVDTLLYIFFVHDLSVHAAAD